MTIGSNPVSSQHDDASRGTTLWQSAPSPDWAARHGAVFPLLGDKDVVRIAGGFDYWDSWPLLKRDGALFTRDDGSQLWFALAAPWDADIGKRHFTARIHLLARHGDRFTPLGPAMPDGFSPGNREWSGSAWIDPGTSAVTLYFTATGQRGQSAGWQQRLFVATAWLAGDALVDWSPPRELMPADGNHYRVVDQAEGEPGKIKALRDPDYFRDPADGSDWIVFTGSSAQHPGEHDGVIGLARIGGDGMATPCPPLVAAWGFNNELERAHLRCWDGRYYLFWSTQRYVFAAGHEHAATGLYGAVADSLAGPWALLNGDGLIAGNPDAEPLQTYSWLVLPDHSITSFVDLWGMAGRDAADQVVAREQFGGTFAPFTRLALNGDTAHVTEMI